MTITTGRHSMDARSGRVRFVRGRGVHAGRGVSARFGAVLALAAVRGDEPHLQDAL
eukprot:SAG11_NODE_28285_length_323_cov_0.919643_1_plen_55_part_01